VDRNCLEGHLVDVTYFGEVAHYDFARNGIRLKVSELNPRHLGHDSQAIIFANIRPEDVLILSS
jgi:hypothetical protein